MLPPGVPFYRLFESITRRIDNLERQMKLVMQASVTALDGKKEATMSIDELRAKFDKKYAAQFVGKVHAANAPPELPGESVIEKTPPPPPGANSSFVLKI